MRITTTLWFATGTTETANKTYQRKVYIDGELAFIQTAESLGPVEWIMNRYKINRYKINTYDKHKDILIDSEERIDADNVCMYNIEKWLSVLEDLTNDYQYEELL